jgi:hypothetical protein
MKYLLKTFVVTAGMLLTLRCAMASSDVDHMSDIEVCDYAVRMSEVLEDIQNRQTCQAQDIHCIRAEFARHGISYDDKVLVHKRLSLMIGSIQ